MPTPDTLRIGEYEVHPLRRFVPEWPVDRLQMLADDLFENGQQEEVWLDDRNRIIDGRARARALLIANEQHPDRQQMLTTRDFDGRDDADVAAFILGSMNRLEYTTAQKAVTAATLMPELRIDAAARRDAGTAVQNGEWGEAAIIAGDRVGISKNSVRAAERLLAETPDLVELVHQRKILLAKTLEKVDDLQEGQREQFLDLVRVGRPEGVALEIVLGDDDEWVTPPEIVRAIRWALDGNIACDPCSPATGAYMGEKFGDAPFVAYTKTDDGLAQDWPDATFCNPPFSDAERWVDKAIATAAEDDGVRNKRVYLMLPVRPDTDFQQRLFRAAWDVLFLSDRVVFHKPGAAGPVLSKGAGRISIMIAGLSCTVVDLVSAGLTGTIMMRMKSEAEYRAQSAEIEGYLDGADTAPEHYDDTDMMLVDGDWRFTPEAEERWTKTMAEEDEARQRCFAMARESVAEARRPIVEEPAAGGSIVGNARTMQRALRNVTTFVGDGPLSNILITGDSARAVTLWGCDRKNAFIVRTDELGGSGTMRATLPADLVRAIMNAKPNDGASARIDFGENSVSVDIDGVAYTAEPTEKAYSPIEKIVASIRDATPTVEFEADRKAFVERIRGLRAGRRGRGGFDVVIDADVLVRMARDNDDVFFPGTLLAKAATALRGRRMTVSISRLHEGFVARLASAENEAIIPSFPSHLTNEL